MRSVTCCPLGVRQCFISASKTACCVSRVCNEKTWSWDLAHCDIRNRTCRLSLPWSQKMRMYGSRYVSCGDILTMASVCRRRLACSCGGLEPMVSLA